MTQADTDHGLQSALFESAVLSEVKTSARSNGRVRDDTYRPQLRAIEVRGEYDPLADAVIYQGSCEHLLTSMPSGCVQLTVTSPPYNIGKPYERPQNLDDYLDNQKRVIEECVRVTKEGGSICWQVGNHIRSGEVFPLDSLLYPIFRELGLRLRNRIVWHYEHGLHASRRFSGRYETIMWFTKGDDYYFDLDPIRVPQKYPNKKHFRGPNKGKLSSNPKGKNPGDVWLIPNVKWNHVEKTIHPCQFPIELVERLVLSMSRPGDLVLDPYGGVGSSLLAALLNGRRAAMAETDEKYVIITKERLHLAENGCLRTRPMSRPVYAPPNS